MNVPIELQVTVEARGHDVLITPAGELDVYTSPKLKEKLIAATTTDAARLLVDLGRVSFIDSIGLGVLLSGLQRASAVDATLELICDEERILNILRLTSLDEVFVVHDSMPPQEPLEAEVAPLTEKLRERGLIVGQSDIGSREQSSTPSDRLPESE